jgi:hypothetical protein
MALATLALARLEAPIADCIEDRSEQSPPLSGVYYSLTDFFTAEFDEADELFAGLHRGEVAFLTSDEAQSKTRLLLQMTLGLAGGQTVLPWSPKDSTPRRIIYVNGDAAASRLRAELQGMLHIIDAESSQDNFHLLADVRLHHQPLNLYRDSHWHWFTSYVKNHPADLVIIDGMREPLTLTDRSSAAARLQLLRNAHQLAADHDCAVLIATTSARRKPLTGTALAGIADTLYQLLGDQRRGEDYRQWHCPQSRWALPEALDLQRDDAGRGYRLCESEAKAASGRANRAKAVELEREREAARMAELMQRFEESDLPPLAYRLNEIPQFDRLPKDRHAASSQTREQKREQRMQNAEMIADEDNEEKLDTLTGFTMLPAADLLSQKSQASPCPHKRRSKKQRRRR